MLVTLHFLSTSATNTYGGVEVHLPAIVTSALEEESGQLHAPIT
jgi:hypothetical protein